jgi:succinate-semialdehyde dehydrogenase/glutarate-semialdehyde dehydrogenase
MDPKPLYLNGQWVTSENTIEVNNPATGEIIASVSTVDREGVAQAIADAQAAFDPWRKLTATQRSDMLMSIADAMTARFDEISRIITLENGKALSQSEGEVRLTIDHFRWFAEEGRRAYGRIIPNQVDGLRHLVLRHPIGVVGAIAPWNFPLLLAVRKVAPGMAAGCPVILKPATQTCLSAIALAECMDQVGVPAGVFQMLVGKASEISGEMLSNPDCRKITFTGSTPVGKILMRGAAETVTKLSLELGGNGPFIVYDDADLAAAVDGLMIAKFRNTGQSCIGANRVYVQASVYDAFVDAFVARVKKLKIGNGLDEGVDIGAMVDEAGLEHAIQHIEDAKQRGGRVLAGGGRWGDVGTFLEPTVIADVPHDATCMHDEIFAPVAPIARFDTEEEALRLANDTPYGLSAYAYTENVHRALRSAEALEAGSICINAGVPTTSQCPFGGLKESGQGRELGIEGLDAFFETKHVAIGLNDS